MKKTMNEIMDAVFAPDITVKLDSASKITACQAVTPAGAAYLLKYTVLECPYDYVSWEGLTVEIIEAEPSATPEQAEQAIKLLDEIIQLSKVTAEFKPIAGYAPHLNKSVVQAAWDARLQQAARLLAEIKGE